MQPLRVPELSQATGYACGNTSLAAVAQFFGKPFTPAQLAQLAGTTASGTDHDNMVRGARATGAHVIAKANGSVDELADFVARGLPPIVGWWSGDVHFNPRWKRRVRRKKDYGHYSVVTAVTARAVTLMDPEAATVELDRARFMRHWYDTDTDRYTKVLRWYLVMSYSPQS